MSEQEKEREEKEREETSKAQEIATNVVLKLQKLGMLPAFAWTGMDLGSQVADSFPTKGYTDTHSFYGRTVKFSWGEWVHIHLELRKPYLVEGPWNPAKLVVRGILSQLPDCKQKESSLFLYEYKELRALLALGSGKPVFYHPDNSTAENELLWHGRYKEKL